VLSIGAGLPCDGQLLIVSDVIGRFQAFTPKFVKKYCNVAKVITNAMKDYCADVRAGKFPSGGSVKLDRKILFLSEALPGSYQAA
jgi:3-methyl-2-oxobutanoate hydroxymethyltransferase